MSRFQTVVLGEIIVSGGIQTGPFGSQLKASEYVDDANGVPVVMPQDISNGRIDSRNIARISKEKAASLSRYQLQCGDVVFPRRGDLSRIAVVSAAEEGWICGTGCLRARPDPKLIDSGFLGQLVLHSDIEKWLINNAVGQTMLNLNSEILAALPLVVPSLPEQKKISGILSEWDRAFEFGSRLVSYLRNRQRAMLQRIFSGEVNSSAIRPSGWIRCTLGDIGKVVSGGTPDTTRPDYWGGGIPWCIPTDVTRLDTRFIAATERTITIEGLRNSSATLLPAGSVIVCTRATVGECAINTVPMATNQGFKSIVPSEALEVEFVYYLIRSLKREIIRRSAGSTFLEISKRDFERIPVRIPPRLEQARIAGLLGSMDDEIVTVRQWLRKIQAQKRGLMQKLLTGEWRVNVD